jgi:hypothetical protein
MTYKTNLYPRHLFYNIDDTKIYCVTYIKNIPVVYKQFDNKHHQQYAVPEFEHVLPEQSCIEIFIPYNTEHLYEEINRKIDALVFGKLLQ